ncbi:MAG: exosortase [Deltaproteobacteria bacterium]|nr:exosortase [Deltaproteobacteria bacterium]
MKIGPQQIKLIMKELSTGRNALFLLFATVAFMMAFAPIKAFYATEMGGYYTHIVLIPLVSLYLLYLKRTEILANPKYSLTSGLPVLIAAVVLFIGGWMLCTDFDKNNFASLIALSVVIFVNGAFILIYGLQAYRACLFPLLFLIFIIPAPTVIMNGMIHVLQVGSTEFTNLLFMASGVPFVRDGFVFQLPNLSVEVARQCSGIRSAMAIFIVAILAGYLFLKSTWKIIFLAVCAVLIAMLKNGIRILTLSLLSNYVNPQILQSSLHREGGIPFFIVALVLLAPILFFLIRLEKKKVVNRA